MAKLTAKQQRFVDEYLIDLNATQAAIRAGYSTETAAVIGCENLIKPNIKSSVDKALAKRSRRAGITQDRVLQEFAKMGLADMRNFIDIVDGEVQLKNMEDISPEDSACIQEITTTKTTKTIGEAEIETTVTKIKLADKKGSLEALGRHLGVFNDKLQIDANMKIEIVDDIK
ncbi:MAG: terminase small subunit [Clostridia bacterium]|nr:terminase small subunit [Clostridia bacterium]